MLIIAYAVYELDFTQSQLDMQDQVCSIFEPFLDQLLESIRKKINKKIVEELFDITIEAQSYIWLRFPDILVKND